MPYPAGGMPPRPPKRTTGKVAALVTVAVVGVAVLALAAYLLLPFDGEKKDDLPANALSQEWSVPVSVSHRTPRPLIPLPGMWFLGDAVVVGDARLGLRAYDHRTGKQLWELERPESAGELCGMSPTIASGTGAVAFDAGGDNCGVLAAVETDTGEVLWARRTEDRGSAQELVEINSETVVTTAGGYTRAYDVRTGEERIVPQARGRHCGTYLAPSRRYIIVTSSCSDATPRHQLSVMEAWTGDDDVWRFPNENLNISRVLSDDPLTAVFEHEDESLEVLVFTDKDHVNANRILHRLKLTGPLSAVQIGSAPAYVTEDAVLVAEHRGGNRQIAVDLKTGKVLWRSPEGQQRLLGMDSTSDTVLIAHQVPYQDGRPPHLELVLYKIHSGKRKTVGTLAVRGTYGLSLFDVTLGWSGGSTIYALVRSEDGKATLRAFEGSLSW